jgi:acetyl esterase
MALHEKIAEFLKKPAPPLHKLGVNRARAMVDRLAGFQIRSDVPVGSIENLMIPTGDKETPIRVFFPEGAGPFPVFVFLHGGGWTVGSIDHYDKICRIISNGSGCATVAVEYGLAPECKFPQPLEECYATIKWIYNCGKGMNLQVANIAVGGDSAGGNLSAAVCLLARERKEFPLGYQVLVYPVTDIDSQTETKKLYGKGYFIDDEDVSWFRENYLQTSQDAKSCLVSPLQAKTLAGLPEALIITAEYDPLRDEGEAYGRRLLQDGVTVIQKRYDGMIHAFLSLEWLIPEEARKAVEFIATQLKRKFQQK